MAQCVLRGLCQQQAAHAQAPSDSWHFDVLQPCLITATQQLQQCNAQQENTTCCQPATLPAAQSGRKVHLVDEATDVLIDVGLRAHWSMSGLCHRECRPFTRHLLRASKASRRRFHLSRTPTTTHPSHQQKSRSTTSRQSHSIASILLAGSQAPTHASAWQVLTDTAPHTCAHAPHTFPCRRPTAQCTTRRAATPNYTSSMRAFTL